MLPPCCKTHYKQNRQHATKEGHNNGKIKWKIHGRSAAAEVHRQDEDVHGKTAKPDVFIALPLHSTEQANADKAKRQKGQVEMSWTNSSRRQLPRAPSRVKCLLGELLRFCVGIINTRSSRVAGENPTQETQRRNGIAEQDDVAFTQAATARL